MSYFSAWQFIRQDVVFVAMFISIILSFGIALLLHTLQRNRERRTKRQGLAACWLATLFELSLALDRMRETTRHLIRNRQRPPPLENVYKSDILLHQWLHEGYLLVANDQEDTGLVKSLHKDLLRFNWNVNQATNTRLRRLAAMRASRMDSDKLQKLVGVFEHAAIRLGCNRHDGMVGAWKQSAELLSGFCIRYELEGRGDLVAPRVIPPEWQMDESTPWMIKDLAPVGEYEWGPQS